MSSSSDSDDIEIDGFPPELANNTRFTSLKSSNDSLTNQKVYLPINSWSTDIISPEIIKTCLRVLKDSSSFSENERKEFLDQLESHVSHHSDFLNSENEWYPKSNSFNLKPHNIKNEINKSSSIKVNIEIPSTNANSNNIKYSIDKPVYDVDRHCWKTSMDFVLQYKSRAISESAYEVLQDNKETQTDTDTSIKKTTLNLPFGFEFRCRSEEKLAFTGSTTNENLSSRLNNDAEIAVLENFENSFEKDTDKSLILNETFRKYKIIIRKTVEKYIREVKKLQTQTESITTQFYQKLTEYQFKWNAQNQLFLTDIERELDSLNTKMNIKAENLKRISKITDKTEAFDNELQNIKFSYSIRLISQMLSNVKQKVTSLSMELNGKNKTAFFNLK